MPKAGALPAGQPEALDAAADVAGGETRLAVTPEQIERVRARAAESAFPDGGRRNHHPRPLERPPAAPEPSCCEANPFARGLCMRCYKRWRKAAWHLAGGRPTRGIPTAAVMPPGA